MNRIKKQGMFFTLDALVATLILTGGILMIAQSYTSEQPAQNLNYLAQDLINVLGELTVSETNNSYLGELIASGDVTHMNNTLLEQIGELWAGGDLDKAQNLTRNLTEGIIPSYYGYGLWVDSEVIYKRDVSSQRSLVTARRLILGVEKTKPLKGHIAKARATLVDTNTTRILSISPAGSGYRNNGWVEIIKRFNFSKTDNILNNIAMYISVHVGDDNDDVEFDLNGICYWEKNNMTTIREQSYSSGRGFYGLISDISSTCISDGENNLTLRLRNNDFHGHTHPGTYLILSYVQNDASVDELVSDFSQRYYFDSIRSYGSSGSEGSWEVLPFHIPEGATNISVTVQVAGRNVRDYTGNQCCQGWWWCTTRCRDIDYQVFLNSDTALDIDDHPAASPLYVYGPAVTASEIQTGTNVVAVFFNAIDNSRWGNDNVEIYSDLHNDPSGSSYVEVNYTKPPLFSGGVIEARTAQQFGGDWESPKTVSFSFPTEAVGISDVFVHIAQILSWTIRVRSDVNTPPGNDVFISPTGRVIPTSTMIPDNTIDVSSAATNYIRVEDTASTTYHIAPNSSLEYGFYLQGYVGYGNVFDTADAANTDAQNRLQAMLGPFVNLENVKLENLTMTDVPTMWGPATIEVRIWN